jgi:organic radical activating enzyme
MFGANPARPQELGASALWIQEVFYTLQGEGPFVGEPALFVRLAGCNLRCTWCDTDFESSTQRSTLSELLLEIAAERPALCQLVVITGGEPFRQDIAPLVQSLLAQGLRVQIETSGSLWVELPLDPRLTIVCSPKTGKLEPALEARVDVYKYVLAAGEIDADDGLPTASTQNPRARCRIARPRPGARVYVMPRDDRDPTRNRANLSACTETALKFGYSLTLQTHKLLGLR